LLTERAMWFAWGQWGPSGAPHVRRGRRRGAKRGMASWLGRGAVDGAVFLRACRGLRFWQRVVIAGARYLGHGCWRTADARFLASHPGRGAAPTSVNRRRPKGGWLGWPASTCGLGAMGPRISRQLEPLSGHTHLCAVRRPPGRGTAISPRRQTRREQFDAPRVAVLQRAAPGLPCRPATCAGALRSQLRVCTYSTKRPGGRALLACAGRQRSQSRKEHQAPTRRRAPGISITRQTRQISGNGPRQSRGAMLLLRSTSGALPRRTIIPPLAASRRVQKLSERGFTARS